MTTLMMTMIGILLAAAAALMVTFYGGGSFFSGSAKAQADTLLNAGSNIRTAANVYLATKGREPADPAALLSGSAIKSLPALGATGVAAPTWQEFSQDGSTATRKAYAVSGVTDSVCRYVNKNIVVAGQATIPTAPQGVTGCFQTGGNNVFYAMINDAANGQAVAVNLPTRAQSGLDSYADSISNSGEPPIPGTGNTPQDIQAQIAWILYTAKTQPANLPKITPDLGDTDVTNLQAPPNAGGSWGQGVITSLLMKPTGGKYGNFPYMTIYISQDLLSPFCQAWQQTARPANVSACDNYYFNHILVKL